MRTHHILDYDPADHESDLAALHSMEERLPMTSSERKSLKQWVYFGHSPETNPWHYTDSDGWELNYLEAYRYHHGYKLNYRFVTIE